MKLKKIIETIEKRIPLNWQEDWDHCGLNLGSIEQKVDTVLFSYDVCKEVVDFAIKNSCEMIVSHHPFRMSADVCLNLDSYEGYIIQKCIQNNIALYCLHTNHDASYESLNHHYLKKLKLKNLAPLSVHEENSTEKPIGLGAFGMAEKAYKKPEIISVLKTIFKTPTLRWIDSGKNSFQKIGICTGSGASFLKHAIELKLDLFITGDVKYHQAITAKRHNLAIADVGHFYSEKDSVVLLKEIFSQEFGKSLQYKHYTKLQDAFEFI